MIEVIGNILKSQLKSYWKGRLQDAEKELADLDEKINELQERRASVLETVQTCKIKLRSNR